MGSRKGFVQCQQQNLKNCKMRDKRGYCIALINTYFLKKCPFYKEGKELEIDEAEKILQE